jgi:hypothetical protein
VNECGRSENAQLWEDLFRAAVLETNMDLIPRRVLEARKAAGERALHLILDGALDEFELQDLIYATRVLDELKRKCQSAGHSRAEQPTQEVKDRTTQQQRPEVTVGFAQRV